MKKIPLEPVIIGSYKFLSQNIISIIGTLWFPVLVFFAVVGAFAYGIVPHNWLHGDFTPVADPGAFIRERLPVILSAVPCIILTMAIAGAMIQVGILRHALGEKTKPTYIFFSLGARVWRMIVAVLLCVVVYVCLVLAVIAAVIVVNLAMAVIPNMPHILIALVRAVLVIIGIGCVLYVMVRLSFFLPAVVVAENKVGVRRAWKLGKGNVWRILAVVLVVTVPAVIIGELLIYITAFSTIFSAAALHPEPQTPEQAINFMKTFLPVLPVLGCVYLALVVALTGLKLGAIGKAYKAVTAPDEAAV